MNLRTLAPLLLLTFAAACSTAHKRTYQVEVMNISSVPLSVGLVKTGGSVQEGFTAPEHVAINAPDLVSKKWGTLVKPGQTRLIGPAKGKFEPNSEAILRIYAGDLAVDQLIAYGRKDPGRLDIYIPPGASTFVIDQRNGVLKHSIPDDSDRRPTAGK
jgi:hypothetical protein